MWGDAGGWVLGYGYGVIIVSLVSLVIVKCVVNFVWQSFVYIASTRFMLDSVHVENIT